MVVVFRFPLGYNAVMQRKKGLSKMYDMENFAKRIQTLRKAKGLSQEELAGRLSVTAQAVSKWENGQSYPDITTIPTVAAVLGVTVDGLFGRKPEEEKHTFPKTHGGLPLVHSHGNVACYSDKEGLSLADGPIVQFADGSTAELFSRLARNKGKGNIKFLQSGDRLEADEGEKSLNYEFPYADKLDIEVVSGQCDVVPSDDGKTRVDVGGAGWFVRHHHISQVNETLIIRFDGESRDYPSSDGNRIRISLPCKKGRHAQLRLNARGGISAPLDFEGVDLTVNGSGGVHIGKIGICCATINGSGNFLFDGGGTATLNINGSGAIDAGAVGELVIGINGSGDIIAGSAASLIGQINGSGNIEIGKIGGGNISLQINGSGDLHIEQGECELFEIKVAGEGDVDAEGVTARRANIYIEHNGEVKLGRVLEESSEQAKKNGTITIFHRGPLD
jgi:transcriptional regulator with XRE-family HTH domain